METSGQRSLTKGRIAGRIFHERHNVMWHDQSAALQFTTAVALWCRYWFFLQRTTQQWQCFSVDRTTIEICPYPCEEILTPSNAWFLGLTRVTHRCKRNAQRFKCFQNGGRPPSWIFKFKVLTTCSVKRASRRHPIPNFMPIYQTFTEVCRFFDFLKWRTSAILDLSYACFELPRRVFAGLCHHAKFDWNLWSSFVNSLCKF